MEKKACPFGQLFREQRKIQGISLWTLAVGIPYRQGNIQRIERGLREPRIGLAIRMLSAIGVDAGAFLEKLARQEGFLCEEVQRGAEDTVAALAQDARSEMEKVKCPFGPLLRAIRLAHEQSQKRVAEKAAYTLRNLINVEKGTQEPGVVLALKLVIAAGETPEVFFHQLQDVMKNTTV